jgi:hypothetical protein
MLKNWFDAGEAQEFGKNLAETFSQKNSTLEKKKANLDKRAKLLGKLTTEVSKFGQTHRLNFYKKAKLGNAFKWTLLEKGFDAGYVDLLTKEVILALK